MIKIIAQSILFCILLWTSSYAQEFEVLSHHDQSIEMVFTLPAFKRITLSGADGFDYQSIQVEKWNTTNKIGFPQLPFTAVLLQVPSTGNIQLEILEQLEDTIFIPSLYPVPQVLLLPGKKTSQRFTKEERAYHTSAFYPAQTLLLDERAVLRGVSVVRLKVYPFQWQAQTGILRYIKTLRFRLNFSQPFSSYATLPTPYEKLMRTIVTGYRDLSRDHEPKPTLAFPQQETLQFKMAKAGMYQIDYQSLQASGISDACLSQGQLVLSNRSQQIVPQWITQYVRGFGNNDRLEFYVPSYRDTFTENNVYRLSCWDWSQSSLRPKKSSQIIQRGLFIDGTVTGNAQSIDQFKETIHFEENTGVWLETPHAPPKDYWFWKKLTSPNGQTLSLLIPHPVTGKASLQVALQGQSLAKSSEKHRIHLYLNEVFLGEVSWDSLEDKMKTFSISQGILVEGENSLRFEFPKEEQVKGNTIYLNWVEVTYPRQLIAVQDELTFSVSERGRMQMHLSGFSQADVRIFDVTHPTHVKEVINFIHESGQIIFEAFLEENKTYYATTSLRPIEQIELLPSTHLKDTHHQVDYILITTEALLPTVRPLLTHRENQGLRTLAVSVEAIYHEFSSGFPTPYAIKEFLRYAYQHWPSPAPSYVLFWGESSLDYKNYLNKRVGKVPPYLIETLFGVTPDDNWFVSVEGEDPLPDMMVGRLPGKNEQEVKTVMDKIIAYETRSPTSSHVLLISDDEANFEQLNNRMETSYLSHMTVNKVYMSQYDQDAKRAKADIIKYLNEGALITQYIGHGHITIWAQERLLNKDQIKLLDNSDNLTLVLALNCLNAYFVSPNESSLGEELLLAPNKGAFAVFSSAGLSYSWQYEAIDEEFFSGFFKEGKTRLGELVTQAKIATYGKGVTEDALSIFTLIGDPATRLPSPPQ